MPKRSHSWVVSLILLAALLLTAIWMGPDASVASIQNRPIRSLEAPAFTESADAARLTALLNGDAAEALLDDPFALTLNSADGELADFESLVKVGDDDTPRGTFPRSIQTLTDPSLFARLDVDRFIDPPFGRIQTAIAALPPKGSSEDPSALSAPAIDGFGFDPAAPTRLDTVTAVPEPGSMSLLGTAMLGVTALRRFFV
jgi:hypothetical protein